MKKSMELNLVKQKSLANFVDPSGSKTNMSQNEVTTGNKAGNAFTLDQDNDSAT